MSQANAGLTPEQIKKNRDILNDHRVFVYLARDKPMTVEMERQIADFLKTLDAMPELKEQK